MPGTKKVVRKTKKRKYAQTSYKKQNKAIILYCPQICPDVMRVQLKYVARAAPSGGAVVDISDNVYRGNGAFDPVFAVGGGQPIGFDQWSAFYRKYRVTGSKVELKLLNDSDSTVYAFIVANNTSALFTNKDQLIEQQYAKSKLCARKNSGTTQANLSMYMSVAKVRGRPADIVEYEQGYAALNTANPNLEFFWHIGAYAQGSNSTNFATDYEAVITYYIDFFDRETLVQS